MRIGVYRGPVETAGVVGQVELLLARPPWAPARRCPRGETQMDQDLLGGVPVLDDRDHVHRVGEPTRAFRRLLLTEILDEGVAGPDEACRLAAVASPRFDSQSCPFVRSPDSPSESVNNFSLQSRSLDTLQVARSNVRRQIPRRHPDGIENAYVGKLASIAELIDGGSAHSEPRGDFANREQPVRFVASACGEGTIDRA